MIKLEGCPKMKLNKIIIPVWLIKLQKSITTEFDREILKEFNEIGTKNMKSIVKKIQVIVSQTRNVPPPWKI